MSKKPSTRKPLKPSIGSVRRIYKPDAARQMKGLLELLRLRPHTQAVTRDQQEAA